MIDFKSFRAPGLRAWWNRRKRHSTKSLLLVVNNMKSHDPWDKRPLDVRHQTLNFKH